MKPLWKKAWIVMCVVFLCIAFSFVGCKEGNTQQSTFPATGDESVVSSSEDSELGSESIETGPEDDESDADGGGSQNSSSGGTWTGTYLPT